MVPIEEIAKAFSRTYHNTVHKGGNLPLILKNVQYLANLIEAGEKRRLRNCEKFNTSIPRFCIFSVTWECNLECVGCYAFGYSSKGSLSGDDIARIAAEASDLGSFIFIIGGGEPFMVHNIANILSSINKSLFFIFTNGTKIDESITAQLKKAKNIIPIISVEGDSVFTDYRRGSGVSEQIKATMERLRKNQIGFGFSSMATHQNLKHVTSRDWFDKMWDQGARFGFIIDYIPIHADVNQSMILSDEDMKFKENELAIRNREAKPAVVNFPPDEYNGQSCQSAGRGIIHINADGFVEPCPFSHYACDNVKDKPLVEILSSRFMCDIRDQFEHEPFGKSCMLFEHEKEMEKIAAVNGAFKTESKQSV